MLFKLTDQIRGIQYVEADDKQSAYDIVCPRADDFINYYGSEELSKYSRIELDRRFNLFTEACFPTSIEVVYEGAVLRENVNAFTFQGAFVWSGEDTESESSEPVKSSVDNTEFIKPSRKRGRPKRSNPSKTEAKSTTSKRTISKRRK